MSHARRSTSVATLAVTLAVAGCDQAPRTPPPAAVSEPAADAGTTDGRAPVPDTSADVIRDKTFDDLQFDLEPGDPFDRSLLTDSIEGLFGQRVRLRGYILPTAKKRLKQFVLVRDNQECCFGPGAALYDCVLIDMEPGELATFSIRPVTVEGRFAFNEVLGPDGYPLAIFQMTAQSVR